MENPRLELSTWMEVAVRGPKVWSEAIPEKLKALKSMVWLPLVRGMTWRKEAVKL